LTIGRPECKTQPQAGTPALFIVRREAEGMALFNPSNRTESPAHERVYAIFEVWYTLVDLAAALLFVFGSVLFFWSDTRTPATWMFVIGSVCFALKPTIRLMREVKLLRMGKIERLAERETEL
jgi:hypothetical protein